MITGGYTPPLSEPLWTIAVILGFIASVLIIDAVGNWVMRKVANRARSKRGVR